MIVSFGYKFDYYGLETQVVSKVCGIVHSIYFIYLVIRQSIKLVILTSRFRLVKICKYYWLLKYDIFFLFFFRQFAIVISLFNPSYVPIQV